MGLYFEDYRIGDRYISPTRTITETDVVNFAAMSGDMNELHTSESYARGTPFKERVVHGLLGLSICHGLMFRLGLMEGTGIAFLGLENWRFEAPIFIGDTIHTELEVLEATPSTGKKDRGKIRFKVRLVNTAGVVTQSGVKKILVKSKAGCRNDDP